MRLIVHMPVLGLNGIRSHIKPLPLVKSLGTGHFKRSGTRERRGEMKKLVILLLLGTLVSGCGGFSQKYKHKETGQQSKCESWGFGWLGFPIAIATFYDCKREHERNGYIPTEE